MVNLLGKGFIGSWYSELYPCIVNDRNDLVPKHNDVLYMISTVDNYNVETNPYIDIDTNLITLVRTLENWRYCCRGGTFNFVSSWFVYGNTELPATETSACNPRGFYSITKLAAEQLLISYCETYNLKYRILRLANVLGPGDKKVGKKKNVTTYIIDKMKQNKPIDIHNNGTFCREYIHVKDACSAIYTVLSKGNINTIYNIGNQDPIEFIDIVHMVQSFGSTSEINFVNFESKNNIPRFSMNCTKLFELGYAPKYSAYDIVKEIYYSK